MRTLPVKYSAGPFPEGREPLRLISIVAFLGFAGTTGVGMTRTFGRSSAPATPADIAAAPTAAASISLRVIMAVPARVLASVRGTARRAA